MGTWRAKKTQWEPAPPKAVSSPQVWDIRPDGTYSKTVYGRTTSGTYVLEQKALSVTPEPGGGQSITYTIEKLTRTDLVVSWNDDLDRLRIFFSRDS